MNTFHTFFKKLARLASASLPLVVFLTVSLSITLPQTASSAGNWFKKKQPMQTAMRIDDNEPWIKPPGPIANFYQRAFGMGMTPTKAMRRLMVPDLSNRPSELTLSILRGTRFINSIVAMPLAGIATLIAAPFLYAHQKITTAWQNRKERKRIEKEFAEEQQRSRDSYSRNSKSSLYGDDYISPYTTGEQPLFSTDMVNTTQLLPQGHVNRKRTDSEVWNTFNKACGLNNPHGLDAFNNNCPE